MSYLLDTSVLARLANFADARYAEAGAAVVALHRRGETLCITPQVLIEFRSVATRPTNANGLGLSTADVESIAQGFESAFALLPDTPDVFAVWKSLVAAASVVGRQVHDARLVAVCRVHGVDNLLTFNVAHFARFHGPMAIFRAVEPSGI